MQLEQYECCHSSCFEGGTSRICQACPNEHLDSKVCKCSVYLEYWNLNLKPLMVYPEVLHASNF